MGRAGLHASWLETSFYTVNTHVAFVDLFCFLIEPRDVEGASSNTELAADALILIDVDDAVLILDDRSWGRTGVKAARLFAVETRVLLNEPL